MDVSRAEAEGSACIHDLSYARTHDFLPLVGMRVSGRLCLSDPQVEDLESPSC
jgi:hypothetical protein